MSQRLLRGSSRCLVPDKGVESGGTKNVRRDPVRKQGRVDRPDLLLQFQFERAFLRVTAAMLRYLIWTVKLYLRRQQLVSAVEIRNDERAGGLGALLLVLVADSHMLLETIFKHSVGRINGAHHPFSLASRILARRTAHMHVIHAVFAIWSSVAGAEARALRYPEEALRPL